MKTPIALATLLWVASFNSLLAQPGHVDPPGVAPERQKVIVVEYSGFDCAPCAEVSALLDKLVSEKKLSLQVLFKNAPSNPEALVAHEAALAAGQQGKFWEMHDLLFAKPQANYSEILDMARSLNLDIKRFQTALDEREFRERVMTDIVEARGMGIHVTPTIFLNGTKLEGIEQIRSMVNAATSQPKDTVDPDRIYEFKLEGSPSFGPEDVPVTIVEFSDFRCHFCADHSRTVTELVAAYPGKIRRVFKHFPIEVNADGKLPHLGSMAAMAQGRFWEMYRALMNKPLTGRDDLISRAVALGFDMERFESDLAAGEGAAIIQRDIDEGDAVEIRMTPTSFINGKMVTGRQTVESLRQLVDAILGAEPAQRTGNTTSTGGSSQEPHDTTILIECFTDLTHPDAGKVFSALQGYEKKQTGAKVQIVYYSQEGNAAAEQLHRAAMAAGAQGRSREMCELILAAEAPLDEGDLLAFGSQLKLDINRFAKDLADETRVRELIANRAEGKRLGLSGRPTVFVKGHRIDGVPTVETLVEMTAAGCCGI
jgi:protein-disulfide isomerase